MNLYEINAALMQAYDDAVDQETGEIIENEAYKAIDGLQMALEEKTGAVCFAAIWLVGLFLMFWDNKKKFVRAYLDSFPPAVSKTDESDE